MDAGALTRDRMLERIIQPDSIFLDEGKNLLIEEFGKDYGVYFSILSAIATGHSRRSRIDNIIGKDTGGYLTMLDETYGIIRKHKPLFSSTNSNVRYRLNDTSLFFGSALFISITIFLRLMLLMLCVRLYNVIMTLFPVCALSSIF